MRRMKWMGLFLLGLLLVTEMVDGGGRRRAKPSRTRRTWNKGKQTMKAKSKSSSSSDSSHDKSEKVQHTGCKTTKLEGKLKRLAEQIMMQQFYVEEQTRANGASGIKKMRLRNEGTRPYYSTSHADDFTVGGIHDHSDFHDTIGMGEVIAVLNGIEFMTRHNDYRLVMKSTTSKTYGETEKMPFPDVPPSVTRCGSLKSQIAELRKYFRAWKEQDDSVYDYKPYFKANLCYMEGAWTTADPDTIQEVFFSERHWLEADSWRDLFQKIRFSSYSGTKENLENYAFMPTTLWKVKDNGECVFGQWMYRIYCHPLKDDLPLNRLRAVDDLKTRMSNQLTYEEYVMSRNARFQINPLDGDKWYDGPTKHGLLDELMIQIPGMDNYNAVLHDEALGNTIKEFNTPAGDDTPLNVAYYHRWIQNEDNGAMGVKVRHRGFNDENLWVAMNTQENILPVEVQNCYSENNATICQSWKQRWSYAIPMEIIYTTPLNSWNPFNIEFKGFDKSPLGKTVFQGPGGTKRDGSSKDKALNGTNSSKFYFTPEDFFTGNEIGVDPADTPKNHVYVLDSDGDIRNCRSSGIRTFLPEIPELGILRQRFPVAPVYGSGSPIDKELQALKDIIMEPEKYDFMIRHYDGSGRRPIRLMLTPGPAGHVHQMSITEPMQEKLDAGESITVVTSQSNSHTHTLTVVRELMGDGTFKYKYTKCGETSICWDGHPNTLKEL